jgi:sarcosine oxidase
VDRRTFIRVTGAQAGLLAAAPGALTAAPYIGRNLPHVVVIGAGAFGGWTAYWLRVLGAQVTLVDAYGAGNTRATSGDETRGIRTAYGQRELWTRWASESIRRWKAWDAEWSGALHQRHFFTTGDLILRPEWDTFLEDTRATWEKVGVRYEVLTPEEVRYRWPQIELNDMGLGVYEPDAGVARSRRVCESVAEIVRRMGGDIRIAQAAPGRRDGDRLLDVEMRPGERLGADAFVFACGVWLPKVLPEVMENRMRASMGNVYYLGTPPGDNRFTFPNMPSFNVGGTTGWPALGPENRGFRVRFGGRPQEDPDLSERIVHPDMFGGMRDYTAKWFPALADVPILETRACHYDQTVSRNFILDRHPHYGNVWIAGGGNAEGFKMGPVAGEFMARRVLGLEVDEELVPEFRWPADPYEG